MCRADATGERAKTHRSRRTNVATPGRRDRSACRPRRGPRSLGALRHGARARSRACRSAVCEPRRRTRARCTRKRVVRRVTRATSFSARTPYGEFSARSLSARACGRRHARIRPHRARGRPYAPCGRELADCRNGGSSLRRRCVRPLRRALTYSVGSSPCRFGRRRLARVRVLRRQARVAIARGMRRDASRCLPRARSATLRLGRLAASRGNMHLRRGDLCATL